MSGRDIAGVAILGSTGSVGENTLDVVARHPDRFRVVALGAHRNAARLAEQALRFSVPYVALADATAAAQLESELRARGSTTRWRTCPSPPPSATTSHTTSRVAPPRLRPGWIRRRAARRPRPPTTPSSAPSRRP